MKAILNSSDLQKALSNVQKVNDFIDCIPQFSVAECKLIINSFSVLRNEGGVLRAVTALELHPEGALIKEDLSKTQFAASASAAVKAALGITVTSREGLPADVAAILNGSQSEIVSTLMKNSEQREQLITHLGMMSENDCGKIVKIALTVAPKGDYLLRLINALNKREDASVIKGKLAGYNKSLPATGELRDAWNAT